MALISDITPRRKLTKRQQFMRAVGRRTTLARRSMVTSWKWLLVLLIVIIVAVITVVYVADRNKPAEFESAEVNKANFTVFYPRESEQRILVDPNTLRYDQANNGLSYTASVDGKTLIVTQQPKPDIFNTEKVYEFKIQQSNRYATVETSMGAVELTRPKELGGATLAWANAKGTLLLARSQAGLSEGQWKLLIDSLTTIN